MLDKFVIVFDLDDTLYKEIEYVNSAFIEISNFLVETNSLSISKEQLLDKMLNYYSNKKNVFKEVIEEFTIQNCNLLDLVAMYRNHSPNIKLSEEAFFVLNYLRDNAVKMALITDGRSKQQRSKIKALNLNAFMEYFVISEDIESEKPSLKNYQLIENKFKDKKYTFVYVGDNLKKDFVTPNKMGWVTVMLKDNGKNIHSQNSKVNNSYLPLFKIKSLTDLIDILNKKIKLG